MNLADVDLYDANKLAIAFREIQAKISEKQLEDLRELYDRAQGIPCSLDSKNRPQGATIRTCQLVGSLLKKHIGDGPKFGMSWIGYINDSDNWAMRNNIREALRLLRWFGNIEIDKRTTGLSDTENQKTTTEKVNSELDISETTYKAWVDQRIGQQQFRERLIGYWGGCAVTGCSVRDVLVASHIVPWANASPNERLDVHNGLLLTADLDKLFDSFLVSFNSKGEIHISKSIDAKALLLLGVNTTMKLRKLEQKHIPYLQRHESKFRILETRRGF